MSRGGDWVVCETQGDLGREALWHRYGYGCGDGWQRAVKHCEAAQIWNDIADGWDGRMRVLLTRELAVWFNQQAGTVLAAIEKMQVEMNRTYPR